MKNIAAADGGTCNLSRLLSDGFSVRLSDDRLYTHIDRTMGNVTEVSRISTRVSDHASPIFALKRCFMFILWAAQRTTSRGQHACQLEVPLAILARYGTHFNGVSNGHRLLDAWPVVIINTDRQIADFTFMHTHRHSFIRPLTTSAFSPKRATPSDRRRTSSRFLVRDRPSRSPNTGALHGSHRESGSHHHHVHFSKFYNRVAFTGDSGFFF